MLDINNLMNDLAFDRPVFHSEADFQLALALCIHDAIPDGKVRLEYKPFPAEPMYLDIWLPGIGVAVELKYRTRKLNLLREGECFALREMSAQDLGRYNFLKDIQRLERLRTLPDARAGFAVLLTNDRSYWEPRSRHTVKIPKDAAFRIHEGRTITGQMAWGRGGTTEHWEPTQLNGSYDLHWQDYAKVGDGPHQQFRYLTIQTDNARGSR